MPQRGKSFQWLFWNLAFPAFQSVAMKVSLIKQIG
jgi:hypothetical protein